MYEMDQRIRAVRARELSTMTPALRSHYVAQYGSVETFFERAYPVFPSGTYFRLRSIPNWWNLGGHAQVTAFALLWPWATFLSLMVFRASMRRARVRAVHVLRCVIYTADVAALAAAAVCVTWFFYDRWLGGTWSATWWRFGSARGVPIVVAVLFMILTYRLWIAYRRYLRFEHALATAIASQLMIALLTLKLIADFYSATRWGG
jgi:hypothetical protein